MKCPQCGNDYVCPCESCTGRNKDKIPWIRSGDNDEDFKEACPQCGFCKGVHWWFEEQFRQYEEFKNK